MFISDGIINNTFSKRFEFGNARFREDLTLALQQIVRYVTKKSVKFISLVLIYLEGHKITCVGGCLK
jgi:hypothetical protein